MTAPVAKDAKEANNHAPLGLKFFGQPRKLNQFQLEPIHYLTAIHKEKDKLVCRNIQNSLRELRILRKPIEIR